MLSLSAQTRNPAEKLDTLRRSGKMPAVFYGKVEKSTPISVSERDFKKILREAGESTIVTLDVEGEKKEALIHDIDVDPVTGAFRHADFYVVEKGKAVQVHVPIEFDGVAPAVKELGGVLVKVLHELEIEAMPKDLPHEIKVSVETLVTFESQLHAKDIVLPSGVTLITDPEEVVVLVAQPKEEKEEEAAPIDLSSIEVEKKGKKEEEGEAASE